MKIGLLVDQSNKEYAPDVVHNKISYIDTVFANSLSQLFPDESFYIVDINDPDFDMMENIDLIFHLSDCRTDKIVEDYIDDLPCKLLTSMPMSHMQLSGSSWADIIRAKRILDVSDFVISTDHEHLDALRLFTDTPVFWWPLPYPIETTLAALKTNDMPEYDIVIPYGPLQSVNSQRNGYVAPLIGNKIIGNVEGYNSMGILNWTDKTSPLNAETEDMLRKLGCNNFVLIPRMSSVDIVRIIAKAKMMLFLDYTRVSGKFAIEAAIAKTPLVFGDTIPFARYIYGTIGQQNPFDVEAAIGAAKIIQCGRWEQSWLDKAYDCAMDFSIENSARILAENLNDF